MWAFAVDLMATQMAHFFWSRSQDSQRPSTPTKPSKSPVVECDESYFGLERQRGIRKQPVCGIFERGGAVFTEVVLDVKAKTLIRYYSRKGQSCQHRWLAKP